MELEIDIGCVDVSVCVIVTCSIWSERDIDSQKSDLGSHCNGF